MVAEQKFRTTTPEPASSAQRQSAAQHHLEVSHRRMMGAARPRWSSLRQQLPRHQASQQSTQEMLENATLLTQFGKEDTAAKSQRHAARIQDTLVNAVENAEVTEIKCAVFRALTRLRVTEMKEFDRIETQTTDENNETLRRETVSYEFRTS